MIGAAAYDESGLHNLKKKMKKILIVLVILLFVPISSAIIIGSNSGLIYICMHGSSEQNLQMYATTNQSNSCPQPPDNHHTSHAQMPSFNGARVGNQSIMVVQHDPDCIIRKVPAFQ